MKTLFIVIKQKYFDQIKAGTKKEEYREITEYWRKRLEGREYDYIIFQAGYRKNAPRLKVVWCGYYERKLIHEFFGNEEKQVFAIRCNHIVPLNSK